MALPIHGGKHLDKSSKSLMKYKCQWCDYRFKQYVGRYDQADGDMNKGKKNVSSQVQCPSCGNFIPTWES